MAPPPPGRAAASDLAYELWVNTSVPSDGDGGHEKWSFGVDEEMFARWVFAEASGLVCMAESVWPSLLSFSRWGVCICVAHH